MKRRSLRNVMARRLLVGTGASTPGRLRTALQCMTELCEWLDESNGLHWRWLSRGWARTSDGAGVDVAGL